MVHKNAQRNLRSPTKHTQQHNVYDDERNNSINERKNADKCTETQNNKELILSLLTFDVLHSSVTHCLIIIFCLKKVPFICLV